MFACRHECEGVRTHACSRCACEHLQRPLYIACVNMYMHAHEFTHRERMTLDVICMYSNACVRLHSLWKTQKAAPFFRPRKGASTTELIAMSFVTHLIVLKINYISQTSCKAWGQQCLPKPYVGVWGRLSAKELWDWLAGWLASWEFLMSCCEERRK